MKGKIRVPSTQPSIWLFSAIAYLDVKLCRRLGVSKRFDFKDKDWTIVVRFEAPPAGLCLAVRKR